MATVELTKDTFEQTVTDNDIVFVDWWASWCGPCKMFAPVFEQAAADNPDIVFAKVNTEVEMELAAAAQIQSIPMLMAFREGVLVFAQPGALPGHVFEDLVGQVQALDMEEIHAELAAQHAAP